MIQGKHLVLLETRSAAYQTSRALTGLSEGLSQVLLHRIIGLSVVANIPSHRTLIYSVKFVVETRAALFQWKKSATRILNSEMSQ